MKWDCQDLRRERDCPTTLKWAIGTETSCISAWRGLGRLGSPKAGGLVRRLQGRRNAVSLQFNHVTSQMTDGKTDAPKFSWKSSLSDCGFWPLRLCAA